MDSYFCLYLLGVLLISGNFGLCDITPSIFGAYLPGDVVLGILSPVHSKGTHSSTNRPYLPCTEFSLIAFMQSLVIIQTIETINNSTFLPGIRLGYLMCDSCTSASKALHCVEHMLAVNGSLPVLSDYSNFSPPVKAILGERYSELSIPVAKLLSLYMISQVSCTASAPTLSDKKRYPSFFRVIPSDVYQTEALAKLMRYFSWDWIGVVTIDDDYGNAALANFLLAADKVKVCVEFQEVLPTIDTSEQSIKNAADRIRSSSAKVVLLILRVTQVQKLFKELIKMNISRTWIASDAWSMAGSLMKMKDINKVGDILGFTFVIGNVPGFNDYLQNLKPSSGAWNHFIQEYKQMRFGCPPGQSSENTHPSTCNVTDLQEMNDDYLLHAMDSSVTYSQRVAVYAVAHAIKKILECNNTACPGDVNFPLEKLVDTLHEINFTLDNKTYSFNDDGDFDDGYDLIMWKNASDERIPSVVGKFLISIKDMEVYEDEILWSNNTVPLSRCSVTCPPGTEKSVLNVSCCYTCINCSEGYFSNMTDQDTCQKCPNGSSSHPGSSECQEWIIMYLKWSDPYSIVVMIGTGVGILLLIFSLIFFISHRHNSIIKNTLIYYSIMKVGLTVSFGGVILFLDRPCNIHCMAQQAMYGVGFTLCVSCILSRAFRTFIHHMVYDPNTQNKLSKIYKPFLIIGILTAIQVLICIFWFVFDRPIVDEIKSVTQQLGMNRLCSQGESMVGFGVMHLYIGVLAVVCFLLAFKGRDDETEPIVFSMLIHLFAWLCAIPVFFTDYELRTITQISVIMVSNYGVIFCHFTPKWFKIISKKLEHTSNQSTETILPSSTVPSSVEPLPLQSLMLPAPSGTADAGTSHWDNEPNTGDSEDSSTTSPEQLPLEDDEMADLDNILNTDSSIGTIPTSTQSSSRDTDSEDSTLTRTNTAQFVTADSEMPIWYHIQNIVSIRRRRTRSF